MRSLRYKQRGWFMESARHSLAARGVRTFSKKREVDIYGIHFNYESSKQGKQMTVKGIPIIAQDLQKGRIYPVCPDDVKKEIERTPDEDLRGLRAIEFVNPRDHEQKDAWAQYVRSKRKILIFSQPLKGDSIDGKNPEMVRFHIKDYVLPHEIGHHEALYVHKLTDKNLAMAEARADANVVGMSPDDKAVKSLVR